MATGRAITGPGRVTLIGDHTDYNQGLSLPMGIDLGVTVRWTPTLDDRITVRSDRFPGTGDLPVDLGPDDHQLADMEPPWTRLVGAVVALCRPDSGGTILIESDLPAGAGLSSSAALAVALANAFNMEGSPEVVARLCQAAEHLIGAPVGIMDPLVSAGARGGHAMLIDFATVTWQQVVVPDDAQFMVVDSGQRRSVASSPYGLRVAECQTASTVIGPLGLATASDLAGLHDPRVRRRARHVVTECARVRSFAQALVDGQLDDAGALMVDSHRSLADDFEVSTGELDDLVTRLCSQPGVLGARMTGAGFGGCVVALCRPGALDPTTLPFPAWLVRASDGTAAADGGDQP